MYHRLNHTKTKVAHISHNEDFISQQLFHVTRLGIKNTFCTDFAQIKVIPIEPGKEMIAFRIPNVREASLEIKPLQPNQLRHYRQQRETGAEIPGWGRACGSREGQRSEAPAGGKLALKLNSDSRPQMDHTCLVFFPLIFFFPCDLPLPPPPVAPKFP